MVNFLFCLSLTTEGEMICEFNLPISFWYFSAYINRVAGLENLAPGRHCTSVHECFYWSSWLRDSHCQVEFFTQKIRLWPFCWKQIVFLTFWVLFVSSHFSLLLGCALPKWMSSGLNDRPLAPFAGILSLGIGDTMVKDLFLHIGPFLNVVYAHEFDVDTRREWKPMWLF